MIYIDTSILVAALTAEPRTHEMQDWLNRQSEGQVHTSGWTLVEFSSALSIKVRTEAILLPQRNAALALFRRLIDEAFILLPASRANFQDAARLADSHELRLKGPDALHLAAAMEYDLTLHTLDKRLAEAATALGAKAELL